MMDGRKTILLITQPTVGGAALQVWQLAAGLDKRSFDVTVISPADGWLRARLLGAGISHIAVPMVREVRLLRDLRSLLHLRSIIRALRPHVVHCHSSKAGLLGRLARVGAAVRALVYTPHGFSFEQWPGWAGYFYFALEAASARLTDRIICVSEAERTAALLRRLAPPEKIVVIRNGLTAPKNIQRGRGRLRKILGARPETRIVAMISRLKRPKLPEDLIHAAAILARRAKHGAVRFVFVGGGPLEEDLRGQARRLGIETQVAFLGDRLDVPDLLPDIDVVVLSSSTEGMPYSILEGMAAGKPVVGTRIPALKDLVLDGQNGYLYRPGEAEALADILQHLLRNKALRRRLGGDGRRMVRERFTSQRMVTETEDLYRLLLHSSGATR